VATDQPARPALSEAIRADVQVLWDYHQLGHELHPVDVGIGLGSHDLGVATHTAHLYHRGLFPRIVFTGANAPTTVDRFPRGEAVHYREHALSLGVPDEAILVEPEARHTGENITRTRTLLNEHDIPVRSIILITRPYQQRRAYATAAHHWPGIEILTSAQPLALDDYVTAIGDPDRVVHMLVGDTQRTWVYADQGHAIPQQVPAHVRDAYDRLVAAGYTHRLVPV
jgi:uncharacterized SAM-binding protein YcdF (DUF218 family)